MAKRVKQLCSLWWGTILFTACSAFGVPSPAGPRGHWLDARTGCVFELSGAGLPGNLNDLKISLADGARVAAKFPDGKARVEIDAGAFPSLNSLTVDLSNAHEDTTHKPPRVDDKVKLADGVTAGKLAVIADPLCIGSAKIHYRLAADGATLQLSKDNAGRSILLLTGAHDGEISIDVADADIQALCLTAARRIAGRYGFRVRDAQVQITPTTARSMEVGLRLTFGGALNRTLGGHLHFAASFDIADDMSATASHLRVDGDGATGALISGLLTPVLAIYNSETRNLMVFPQDKIHLTDFALSKDDSLHIRAKFSDR